MKMKIEYEENENKNSEKNNEKNRTKKLD